MLWREQLVLEDTKRGFLRPCMFYIYFARGSVRAMRMVVGLADKVWFSVSFTNKFDLFRSVVFPRHWGGFWEGVKHVPSVKV